MNSTTVCEYRTRRVAHAFRVAQRFTAAIQRPYNPPALAPGALLTLSKCGCPILLYFTLLTVTSSWNCRFELGSSTLPTTMGLPTWASVLALILNCRTTGRDSCPLA